MIMDRPGILKARVRGCDMRFKVIIGEQEYAVEVPEQLLQGAAEFHARLDRDMDRGDRKSVV